MPSLIDLIAPFDPTSYAQITGAQLLQFLSGTVPYTDKGLIISTTDDVNSGLPDVPDANTYPKWQKYVWRRQSATSVGFYVWNENGASPHGVDFLNWVSITVSGIGVGAITTNMLSDQCVTDDKIFQVSASKLTGGANSIPAALLTGFITTSTAATGDLVGSLFGTPIVAPQSIDKTKILLKTISSAQIEDGTIATGITSDKLMGTGSQYDMWRVKSGGATFEAFSPPKIFTSGVVVTTANALKIPQVATAGAGDTGTWQMKSVAELLAQIPTFASTLITITNSAVSTQAHGCGAVPSHVRAVLVMGSSTELGYAEGDEIDITSVYVDMGSFLQVPLGTLTANATNVIFQFGTDNTSVYIKRLSSVVGTNTTITTSKWKVKIYARL